jgi:predicted small lipoprotein YifL
MKKLPIMLLFMILASVFTLLTCGREGPLPPVISTAPGVKSTIPLDGTGSNGVDGFPIDGSILITFTLDMEPSTINNQTITVVGSGGIGPISGSVVYTNGAAIFTPAQNLIPNTGYTVTIAASVTDIYNIQMGTPVSIFFTTETLPDAAPPSVLSTAPSAGSTGVPTNSSISIAFSKPVSVATLTIQLISQLSGTVPGGTVNYNGTTAIFTPQFTSPAVTMDGNTEYSATVKAGLQDLVGNQMVSDYTWTFSTGPSITTTAPLVTATTPTAGSTGVSVSTYLDVTFSEAVNPTTAYITLFSMATGTPVTVPFYIEDSYDYTNNILSYKPTNSLTLAYNSPYTARVSGVIDLYGNVMPDYAWSFTTAKDDTSTSVSADNNPSQYGGLVTFTSTVSSADSGTTAIPTGTVTFKDGTTALPAGTVALAGNSATYAISNLALGAHTISATYNGDSIFSTSTATTIQNVGQATTATTISAPSVTLGANGVVTVLVSSPTGTPSGNVTMSVDGGAAITQALTNGSSVFTITKPTAGSHTLSATYTAQGNFQGSANTGTITVGLGATTTTISAPTVTYGVNGVATVLVTSPSGTPTGSVSLTWDTGSSSLALSTSGSAPFTITSPNAGSHALSASYAAQGSFLASAATGTLTVNQAPTSMVMSAPTISFGANGIVTVTVTSPVPGVPLPVGNVSLYVDGSTTPILGALSSGVATFTIALPIAGTHTLSATYPNDPTSNFGSSSAIGTLNVGSGGTSIAFSSLPTNTYGTPAVLTVTVSSPSGVPTGNISLGDTISGLTTTQTLALTNGAAAFTISNVVGVHSLLATYAAQGSFLGSVKSGTLTVNQATTTTSIGSSVNPSTFGNSVTFTATVTPATATGTMTFRDGATVLGTGTLSSGVATYSTSTLSVATHSITATYSGDTNFVTSTSPVLSQTVNRAATITTLVSSAGGPVTPGTLVTFTATLNPAAATGTVSFYNNGILFTSGTVTLAAGQAAFGTTTLSAGANNITAVYSGDTNYLTSTSNTVVQSVTNASVTISVVSSLPTSTYGNSVTFTATVTGNGAVPTGTVTFKDGSTTLGNGTLSGGTSDLATYATTTLATGAHSITAVYNGDASYSGGQTSSAIIQTVMGTTTTSVVSSTPTSTYGNTVTFTSTVTGSGGTPTGTVSFMDGATLLGAGTLNGSSPDTAAYTTTATALNAGAGQSITAIYNGNTYFTTSTSPTITQTVNQAPTTMSINAPSVASGASGSVSVTVSSGILLTTGNVGLSVDGGTASMGGLTSGVATFNVGILSVGTYTLSATYVAQGNFGGSSATGSLTVGLASSTTSVQSSVNPSVYGNSVTFTATVTPSTATGTVTFKDGSTTLGSGTVSSGVASFSTSTLTATTHNITAVYSGDANYGTSTSSTLPQVVTKASSATSLGSSVNPSTYGQAITFTSTVTPSTATGTVTFKNSSTVLGSGTLSGGVASFSTATLNATSYAITADYNGDTNYLISASDPLLQTVNLASQTITFNPLSSETYGNAAFTLTAAASSGLLVSYSSSSTGVATINGSTVTIVGAGTTTITASQAGNGNYSAAANVAQPLTVNQASTTTAVTGPPTISSPGSLDFMATVAFAGSGLPATTATGTVTFVDNNTAATLCSGTVTGGTVSSFCTITTGTYSVVGTYSGDPNFSSSVSSPYPLTVN